MWSRSLLLIVVLIVAAFLRLWNLGVNPPHLTPDEAALGYNAYSILKTGRDEYGELLPIIFKSFGDYKPGLYIYSVVPAIAIFGLTEFATRLPSALFGIVAVVLVYEIVKKLSSNKNLPFVSAGLLAISPWHILFSRGAWEINLALTLTLTGIYFFLRAVGHRSFGKPGVTKINILLASIFFSLTFVTYQGAKLSTTIIVAILVFVYWWKVRKWLKNFRKTLLIPAIVAVVITFPIIGSFFTGATGRLKVFSVFSYPRPAEYTANFVEESGAKIGDLNYLLYYNEPLNFLRGVMGRYFNHFSGRFLFFEGDWPNPRHTAPNHGVLLLADFILLPLGVFILFRSKDDKLKRTMLLWLFLAPLPSVLSRDQVSAVRAFNMLAPAVVVSSYGLMSIINFAKGLGKKGLRVTSYLVLTFVLLASEMYFLDSYFIHLPKHDSKLWEYGYKQIVEIVTPIQQNYRKIKVQQSFAQPYIYFLFYQKYDPVLYQKSAELVDSGLIDDVGLINNIGNIEFVPIDWSVSRGENGNLFVGDIERIPPHDSENPEEFRLISEINYLNGQRAFRIVEIK